MVVLASPTAKGSNAKATNHGKRDTIESQKENPQTKESPPMIHLKRVDKKPAAAKRVALTGRVTPELKMFLAGQANASEFIEESIRATHDFKLWQRRIKKNVARNGSSKNLSSDAS